MYSAECILGNYLLYYNYLGSYPVGGDLFVIICSWSMDACVLFCVTAWGAALGPWADSKACQHWLIHPMWQTGRAPSRFVSVQTLSGAGILSRACQCVSRWAVSECLSFRLHCVPPLLRTSTAVIFGLTVVAERNGFCSQQRSITHSCRRCSQKNHIVFFNIPYTSNNNGFRHSVQKYCN